MSIEQQKKYDGIPISEDDNLESRLLKYMNQTPPENPDNRFEIENDNIVFSAKDREKNRLNINSNNTSDSTSSDSNGGTVINKEDDELVVFFDYGAIELLQMVKTTDRNNGNKSKKEQEHEKE